MKNREFILKARLSWLILCAVAALGLAITRQYGESWDERQFFKYADRALEAYSTWPRTGSIPLTGNTYDNYGPGYVMLVALAARGLGAVLPWITSDLRHLVYFFTFAVGMWAFFRLCRRWLSQHAALGASLLFATQPLIWGHALISPKDIPFLTFFLLTLEMGFSMVDAAARPSERSPRKGGKRRLIVITIAWAASVFALVIIASWVHTMLGNLVAAAAAGESSIISLFASDIRTADSAIYVERAFVTFLWVRAAFVLVSASAIALMWRKHPDTYRHIASVTPAAAVLGLTTSIRVLGPLAGLMVAVYAASRLGRKALWLLLGYGALALAAMYMTWPYLWPDPLGHFAESLRVMSQYPWRGEVLFNGTMYPSTHLPWQYLPVLYAIQFTEPTWILFAVGLGLAAYNTAKGQRADRSLLALALAWFLLPSVAFVLFRSPLYDNFRQVIFILPPVFMLAGLVLDKIGNTRVQAALIILALLPGIVDGIRLHPYEYVYYNRFVGGVRGAFRRFELDYWGTSYRAAAAYLNDSAAANANIWVEGPTHLLQLYTRPDLKIFSTYELERAERYDYVVALTRFNLDLVSYPDASIEHVIQRQGAVLTMIKKP